MWPVCLFVLLIPLSFEEDVALLIGSDSEDIEIYSSNKNNHTYYKCLENGVSYKYPGEFSGAISAVYLENMGVFVCGGSPLPTGPIELQVLKGCNWLKLEDQHNYPWVTPSTPYLTWHPIAYDDPSDGNVDDVYGKAMVATDFEDGTRGFWITGGNADQGALDTKIAYVWKYNETENVINTIQNAGDERNEQYIKNGHCFVRVKIKDQNHYQYLQIGGNIITAENRPILEVYHCSNRECNEWK